MSTARAYLELLLSQNYFCEYLKFAENPCTSNSRLSPHMRYTYICSYEYSYLKAKSFVQSCCLTYGLSQRTVFMPTWWTIWVRGFLGWNLYWFKVLVKFLPFTFLAKLLDTITMIGKMMTHTSDIPKNHKILWAFLLVRQQGRALHF